MVLKMLYKKIYFLFFLFIFSCVNKPLIETDKTLPHKSSFINKGFALIYEENLFIDKQVKGKIDDRSLVIFQKNLKKDTSVKITNLINSKYLIAKIGKNVKYPFFYNSVISKRISDELDLDKDEPYIEIKEIVEGSSFIAKKAKTFDEEKKVADKAPVENVEIQEIGKNIKKEKKIYKSNFNYIIKIADFYFIKSAKQMKSRIVKETTIKKVQISKITNTKFRVFLGPYDNLNSLKKSFNAINVLGFDSIEIIKK